MKAILEFTLPDEAHEHHVALNGARYLSALRDVDAHIHAVLKYGSAPPARYAEFQKIRDMIRELVPDFDDDL